MRMAGMTPPPQPTCRWTKCAVACAIVTPVCRARTAAGYGEPVVRLIRFLGGFGYLNGRSEVHRCTRLQPGVLRVVRPRGEAGEHVKHVQPDLRQQRIVDQEPAARGYG